MDMIEAEAAMKPPGQEGSSAGYASTQDAQAQDSDHSTVASGMWQKDAAAHINDAEDLGGQYWPQGSAAHTQRESAHMLYPPPPSSFARQIHTIDPNTSLHTHDLQSIDAMLRDPRSVIDPFALGYQDLAHGNAEMNWLGSDAVEGLQPPLGSFVQPKPAQISDPFPPLIPPRLVDPALMGQTLAEHDRENRDWENQLQPLYYEGTRPAVESDLDFRLRNALTNFDHNDSSQSRNYPYPQNEHGLPFPPSNLPEPVLRHSRRDISPSASSTQPLSPPNSPAPTSKRAKARSRARSRSFTPLPETQGPCLTCGKNYRTSTSPGRCARCGLKWERHTAVPPSYDLDDAVPDLNHAREMLYPTSRGRQRTKDDVNSFLSVPGVQDLWVQIWLQAVNSSVPDAEGEESGGKATWAMNQQTTFNQKAKMDRDGEYSTAFVTARLRALWWEAVVYHSGGISLYPVGGDSAGYSEDTELNFEERLEAIGDVLKVDKRTVMDVVEGRGVGAFVGNPWVRIPFLASLAWMTLLIRLTPTGLPQAKRLKQRVQCEEERCTEETSWRYAGLKERRAKEDEQSLFGRSDRG